MERRVKQIIDLPIDIKEIKDVFKRNGFKLFLVGGAVRDTLLGMKIKDFDLATDARPDDIIKMIDETSFQVVGVGEAFGVMNVITPSDQYEIATFRADGEYTDSRRPDTVIFSDIETDVKRRDLTINALFYDIDTEEIVDLVGGILDIKNKVIRTVGSAKDRFNEDRLRILRAIRFSTRLGFKLDDEILRILQKDSSLIGISNERIRDEFTKTVKSAKDSKELLKIYRDLNLFPEVFKGFEYISVLDIQTNDYIVMLAFLLRFGTDLKKRLNSLCYTIDDIRKITFLIKLRESFSDETAPSLKKLQLASKITDEQIREFWKLSGDIKVIEPFLAYELTVDGQWVMDTFELKGPKVGEKIQELEVAKFTFLYKEWVN